MESAVPLVSTEHETGLDKSGCAGVSKSFCRIDECIVKEHCCSFYSLMLEYSFENEFQQFLLGNCPSRILAKTTGSTRKVVICHRNSPVISDISFPSWRWIAGFHPYIDWPSAKHHVAWVARIIASAFYRFCWKPLMSSFHGPVHSKMQIYYCHFHLSLEWPCIVLHFFWPPPCFFLLIGLYICCLLSMICLSFFTPLQFSKEANSLPSALDAEVFLFVSSQPWPGIFLKIF